MWYYCHPHKIFYYYHDNIVILSRYFIIIMIILSSSQDISHFNEELWSHNFRHSSSADLYDGTFCCGFGIFRIFSPLYKTFICRVNKKRCFPSSFLVVLVHLVLLLQALVNCNLDFNRDWLEKNNFSSRDKRLCHFWKCWWHDKTRQTVQIFSMENLGLEKPWVSSSSPDLFYWSCCCFEFW